MSDPASIRSDAELWSDVLRSDAKAFEAIVSRYQNLLCSVAYSRCGDFALSEDLAQDAFWEAWESRDSLRESARLRSWLCGIVRNLAGMQVRKTAGRRTTTEIDGDSLSSATTSNPVDNAISREQEDLVWQSLEEIPESYREPLVLFYREDHSIAEVAEAMDLSEVAVRQRLSRGRAMLKDRIAEIVDGTLKRTRPTTAFTVAVMAGITASAGGKITLAGTGTATALTTATGTLAVVGKVTLGSVLGGLGGAVLGLFGGYLGFAIPAAFAPTRRERDYLLTVGKRTVVISLAFVLAMGTGLLLLNQAATGLFVILWNIFLCIYILVEVLVVQRRVTLIRAETPPETDPNPSSASNWLVTQSLHWERRHFCSSWKPLGIPLFHLNAKLADDAAEGQVPWTTGWIAIGDKAQGLIAMGGIARGGIAIGGLAYGVVAFGGIALGLLSLGGLSVGALAFGGATIGVKAFGGLAIAWKLAAGGQAISWENAIGASVSAPHANDEIAKAAWAGEKLIVSLAHWGQTHPAWTIVLLTTLPQLLVAFMYIANYRRKQPGSTGS